MPYRIRTRRMYFTSSTPLPVSHTGIPSLFLQTSPDVFRGRFSTYVGATYVDAVRPGNVPFIIVVRRDESGSLSYEYPSVLRRPLDWPRAFEFLLPEIDPVIYDLADI